MLAHNLDDSVLRCYSDLNNFGSIAKIVERLPFDLQKRWLWFAAAKEGDRRKPSFEDIVRFVQGEARIFLSSHGRY